MKTSSQQTLQTAFPHAKIIFPTASRSRATIYKRAYTHQWFNNWYMDDYKERQDMMRPGLYQSCNYIHFLLKREIDIIGAEKVVLRGLSQGCATSLSPVLTWDGTPFAATVGMCGWLPFGNLVEEVGGDASHQSDTIQSESEDDDLFAPSDDEDDPFARSDEGATEEPSLQANALNIFREEIDMNYKNGASFQKVPVFLGHGKEDGIVTTEMGR